MRGDTNPERKILRAVLLMVGGALLCGVLATWGMLKILGVL